MPENPIDPQDPRAEFINVSVWHGSLDRAKEILAEHPEISKHLGRAAIDRLCDPANYLGQSGVMVDRVLAALR